MGQHELAVGVADAEQVGDLNGRGQERNAATVVGGFYIFSQRELYGRAQCVPHVRVPNFQSWLSESLAHSRWI